MGLLAWPISSYPPPLGAGTNPRTHVRAKTHSWPAWIIPELTPGSPDERFMLTQRVPVVDRVTVGIQEPLIIFPQPDNSLPAWAGEIISFHKQVSRKREHLFVGGGEVRAKVASSHRADGNLSDKAPSHFLSHKVCSLFALSPIFQHNPKRAKRSSIPFPRL